jgi:hypothetical protein
LKVPPEKYEIGYGRPPQHTRWKKGQCGNPNRKRKRTPKPAVQMIDEFFAGEIAIIENGTSRRVDEHARDAWTIHRQDAKFALMSGVHKPRRDKTWPTSIARRSCHQVNRCRMLSMRKAVTGAITFTQLGWNWCVFARSARLFTRSGHDQDRKNG